MLKYDFMSNNKTKPSNKCETTDKTLIMEKAEVILKFMADKNTLPILN